MLPLTREDILKRLSTAFCGQVVHLYPRVGSTNDVAAEMAEHGAPEGTLVVAEEQMAGRGREGAAWFSPAGMGLWFSLILRPQNVSPSSAPGITLVAGLAVASALREGLDLPALVRWPNDIVVNGRKLCGILTEMRTTAERILHAIVGIGINVNQTEADFPEHLRRIATSIRIQLGRTVARAPVLQKVLESFEPLYVDFCRSGLRPLHARLRSLSAVLGREVLLRLGSEQVTGRAVDIDRDGALVLELRGGRKRRFLSGSLVT